MERKKRTYTEEEAYQRLASLCAAAEYCVADMLKKLRMWDVTATDNSESGGNVHQRIIDRLVAERFIDETRYAHAYVRDKSRYNKWGRVRIAQELRMRHIDESVINEALDEEIDEDDTIETLTRLINQKRPTVKGRNDYEVNMKLIRFALGRGYDMDTISRVISNDY